jgi:hypothetical protein
MKTIKTGVEYFFELPEGYQFVDENGNIINARKIVLEKKKKEYPKTYKECCKVMGINHTNDLDICEHCDYKTEITFYEDSLLEKIESLYRLIICRDAYWKIAGEEMGLGKHWSPSDNNKEPIYAITRYDGYIIKDESGGNDEVLEFPTPEMRDAFKENFDPDIEFCKELL